jgi:glycosyltransferase involved in cell wall biosynthesis
VSEALDAPTSPPVSVVIPALNAAAILPEQLAALADQVDAPPFEVVIADNGSDDDTAALCREWNTRLDVRVVDCSSQRGASFARNVGATEAKGARLLFCDADDVVSPRWVSRMAAALDLGQVVVTSAIVRVTEETPVGWIPPDPDFGSQPEDYMGLMPCVLAGSMAIWRHDYLALGGYDNSYRGGCEDVDFSWRAQLHGLGVVVATSCYLYYRPRTSARAVFRQERRYASQGILLWVRFRDQPGISGPSLRWTLGSVLRGILALRPRIWAEAGLRFAWSRRLGADLGSLEGHLRYRLMRAVPPRQLLHEAA